MKVIRNLSQIVSLQPAYLKDGRNLNPEDLGLIENGSIVFDSEKIIWVGPDSDFPKEFCSVDFIDGRGKVLTPGIVDSHTHLVFGGDRSFEYTMRLNGADYEDIANAGGGILSTMKNTINTSRDHLFNKACERIERIQSYGVKAIEIKSGYALTYEKEKELSQIIFDLKEKYKNKIIIHNTFMAAHAVPEDYKTSSEYLDKVVIKLLKEIPNIIDSVDIFHEEGYFSKEDVKILFEESSKLKIPVRIHADEFNDNKGAVLATKYKALSADHLLCTTDDGVKALANSNTVATILPGTAFFLGKNLANAKSFLDSGCKVALASDYNPGSCHCDNLILIASIAAKNMNFNITQLWAAITMNAAASLNLQNIGTIKKDMAPVFSFFQVDSIDQITYNWGQNLSVELI